MRRAIANPVVHLELRTGDLPRACAFYTQLFDWQIEAVHSGAASYDAIELGTGIQGGVAECDDATSRWLPYVEVPDIFEVGERGRLLGAAVILEPREGPAGWRSVLSTPAGGEIALWQPKV
jgi:predicted enzyme related to lactoylglutathione lyase